MSALSLGLVSPPCERSEFWGEYRRRRGGGSSVPADQRISG